MKLIPESVVVSVSYCIFTLTLYSLQIIARITRNITRYSYMTRDIDRDMTRDIDRDMTRDMTRDIDSDMTRDMTRDVTRDVTRDMTSNS